jgi:hypothetical protein
MASQADISELEQDPSKFRDALPVEIDGVLWSYGSSLRPWQQQNHADVDPALRCIAGYGSEEDVKHWNVYHEMCRGSAKTTAAAANFLYLLWASKRRLSMAAYAADAQQSRIALEMITAMVAECSWLSERIGVEKKTVYNKQTGSEMTCESSDAASAYGKNLDAVYLDEFAAWEEGAIDLWHAVISTAAKRRRCLVHISSNCGWTSKFQFKLVEQIKADPAWRFVARTVPAEWISEVKLQAQRRLLTAAAYLRLWAGVWSDDTGSGLSQAEIDKAIVLAGAAPFWTDNFAEVAIGVDMAYSRDHAGVCVLGIDQRRYKVSLLNRKRFDPRSYSDGQISFADVRAAIVEFGRQYRCKSVIGDSFQTISLFQTLAREDGFLQTIVRQTNIASKTEEAKAVLDCLRDGVLELYQCPLVDDLRRATVLEKPTGIQVQFPRSAETGHGDEAQAMIACLPSCVVTLNELIEGGCDEDYDQSTQRESPYYKPGSAQEADYLRRRAGWGLLGNPVY